MINHVFQTMEIAVNRDINTPTLDFLHTAACTAGIDLKHRWKEKTWVAYYIHNPFAIFNNFFLNTNYWEYWNFSGKLLSTNTNVNFNSQFKNYWQINGQFNRKSENISTSLLLIRMPIPTEKGFILLLHLKSASMQQIIFTTFQKMGTVILYIILISISDSSGPILS
jgi:hypothetical protein